MKRKIGEISIMKKILVLVLSVAMLAALAVPASALITERQTVTVNQWPAGYKPTIDGIINPGEWDKENAVDMNADNCFAWAGEFSCPVYFYYSWDDEGLWCAAEVADPDVCLADSSALTNVYGMDAFQVALDPGQMIAEGQGGGGMFYSIGPMDNGALGACYHPYGGAAEDLAAGYTGAYTKTATGWSFEMVIPWGSIEILADDGYEWHHSADNFINAKICYLDRNEGGAVTNAYTISIEGTDAGMDTNDYAFRLQLSTKATIALEEPEAEAPAEAEAAVEVVDVAPATTAPVTADAGIVVAAVVMAVAAGVVLSKKH